MVQFPQPARDNAWWRRHIPRLRHPYYVDTPQGNYFDPPATAIVEPGNPIGGAFTLPQSFIKYTGTTTPGYPKTIRPGYTTIIYWSYYNGPGKFRPNNGATGPTRIVFPTTMGNPSPTYTSTYQNGSTAITGTAIRSPRPPPSAVCTT